MRIALFTVALIMLGGCSAAFMDTATYGVFREEDVNLDEKNYAAADYLIQQADTFVTRKHLITARPLTDLEKPEMTSRFGKLIPEQVAVRLSQLGYRVDLRNVDTGEDTVYFKPEDLPAEASPDFILSGGYLTGRNNVDVNLRLVDTQSNRVVAAFNYDLTLSRAVAALLEPQPRAYRLGVQ